MTRFWKMCTKCENDGLINSKQQWHNTNRKSIEINRSRDVRSSRTWEKRDADQDTKFQCLKRKDGNESVGQDTDREERLRWRETEESSVDYKRTVCKRRPWSFRHDVIQCGKKTQSSSLDPRPQKLNDGRRLWEGNKKLYESVVGIFPCVNSQNWQRGWL